MHYLHIWKNLEVSHVSPEKHERTMGKPMQFWRDSPCLEFETHHFGPDQGISHQERRGFTCTRHLTMGDQVQKYQVSRMNTSRLRKNIHSIINVQTWCFLGPLPNAFVQMGSRCTPKLMFETWIKLPNQGLPGMPCFVIYLSPWYTWGLARSISYRNM